MAGKRSLIVAALTAVAAAGPMTPVPAHAAGGPERSGVALLRAEATMPLTTAGGRGGLRFAGVAAGGRIDNPRVHASMTVDAAARAHLARYGAAFGADRAGTSLREVGASRTVSGQDVVRLQQRVDGVPVLGAQVVVALRPGRDLGSVSSTLSTAESVRAPTVSEASASAAARTVAERRQRVRADAFQVTSTGRWVFDPAVFGDPAPDGARTGWRFEVTGPGAVRRLVLVDDRSGRVLLDIDENRSALDRVVCDNAGDPHSDDVPCTPDVAARTETSDPSPSAEVESAFTLAGVVSEFYEDVAGLDLTALLGISTPSGKSLAATVNWCYTGAPCPYANAFWNGAQMYYGQGYAGADDVVGHEMTHGVIDQFSQLFYWGQSGAINESLADIMGEIIDHRHSSPGDSADDWTIGEDLPGGAIRSLSDPDAFDQPSTMTSSLYTADDVSYSDNGGVHTDSGVGNKTAYLVSQGGTFGGQTVTGIDTGDPQLTKTATLYADVLQKLASGADYANLASVLEQSCQDLVGAGEAGFVAADCTSVHGATLATQLRTTPTRASQPADAPQTCPTGTSRRVLVDTESGDAADAFVAGPDWVRGASPYWGSNATSGTDAWANTAPWSDASMTPRASSLTLTNAVALPAGQPSYLWFQGWYLLDYGDGGYYDGGTVDVVVGGGSAAVGAWTNGPTRVLSSAGGNPAGGRPAFSGDSHGWIASRADLSGLGGQSVRPRFTLNRDDLYSYPGWFLDDVVVYTCDWVAVVNTRQPTVSGTARVGARLSGAPGTWAPRVDSFAFQWLRDGRAIAGASTAAYTLTAADLGHRVSVRVTASATGLAAGTAVSAATAPVAAGVLTPARPVVTGRPRVGALLRAVPGTWRPAGVLLSYQWLRSGTAVRGATKATYRLTRKDRRKAIAVRVTGRKAGYRTAAITSAPTRKVR